MIIHNGDHAEFEIEHANTPPHERPDWPLPSFDAQDWAKAFLKANESGTGDFLDEGTMTSWFANALMRGHDEGIANFSKATATLRARIASLEEALRPFAEIVEGDQIVMAPSSIPLECFRRARAELEKGKDNG